MPEILLPNGSESWGRVWNVSASTRNQAKAVLLFLYKEVLEAALPWLDDITQVKASRRLPVVLTSREVKALLDGLNGTYERADGGLPPARTAPGRMRQRARSTRSFR